MKPAAFSYLAPRSEDELLATLGEHGADARLLAGGQSLVPMMNFRVVSPAVHRRYQSHQDAELHKACISNGIAIGALTRHAMLEDSEACGRELPHRHRSDGLSRASCRAQSWHHRRQSCACVSERRTAAAVRHAWALNCACIRAGRTTSAGERFHRWSARHGAFG